MLKGRGEKKATTDKAGGKVGMDTTTQLAVADQGRSETDPAPCAYKNSYNSVYELWKCYTAVL